MSTPVHPSNWPDPKDKDLGVCAVLDQVGGQDKSTWQISNSNAWHFISKLIKRGPRDFTASTQRPNSLLSDSSLRILMASNSANPGRSSNSTELYKSTPHPAMNPPEFELQVQWILQSWIANAQRSYAHILPEPVPLNWYGQMIQCLGNIGGGCGSMPFCICCPNPYKQGNVHSLYAVING